MGTKEIWRVVMADGAVKELTPLFTAQPHTNPPRYGYGQYSYPSIRALIVAIAGDPQHMWDVQEILAPGEPTRAELLATAAGVAERVREAAVEACAARRVRCFDAERDAIDDCEDAIRAMDLAPAYRSER